MTIIKISIHSDKQSVKTFLAELNEVLRDEDFSIDENIVVVNKQKESMQYSTRYTLMDLDYDTYDIVERLKELTIKEYSETLIDKDDDKPPLLFVFGKDINHRQVYIKLKIKGTEKQKILCLSFHYAEWKMEFPYA